MPLILKIDQRNPLPLYAQIERGIRALVASGQLKPGEKLPTVRQLAVDLKVNANTIAKVYVELERAGIVETRRGVGTFVSEKQTVASLRDRKRELNLHSDTFIHAAKQLGFSHKEISDHLARIIADPTKLRED
jgi:GntR family transcriptional regulator